MALKLAFLFVAVTRLYSQPGVLPILKQSCQPCHNQRLRTSGLALDSREDMMAGGNRGPSVKPGLPGESMLIQAVEQSGDLKMPPNSKLKPEQIAELKQWVAEVQMAGANHSQAAARGGSLGFPTAQAANAASGEYFRMGAESNR